MGTIRNEYHRFLVVLAEAGAPDDVRKLGRVIWDHLERIAGTTAVRRARSVVLAPLLVQHIADTSTEVPVLGDLAAQGQTFVRVNQLTVGPFRGFMRSETFDLGRPITLVYGANGTGKSSFCEALEMALLGNVNDANTKRIDQRQYCNNARLRRHEIPLLDATDIHGQVVRLRANEEACRFCFVEKNRIDEFARVAGRTAGDQRQIIATLFGIDEFNEFVRGFNVDLDANLTLEGLRALELRNRRQALATAEQLIAGMENQRAEFERQEGEWAHRVLPGQTYDEAKAWLLGRDEARGRLAELRAELDVPVPAPRNIRRAELEERMTAYTEARNQYTRTVEQVQARAPEVSYQQLYEAVSNLAIASPDTCPACRTPLANTVANPFTRAQEGLVTLAELAALQRQRQEELRAVERADLALLDEMRRVFDAMRVVEGEWDTANLPALPARSENNWLEPWWANDRTAWNILLGAADAFEAMDAQARQALAARIPQIEERDRLIALEGDHIRLKALQTNWLEQVAAAQQLIAQFEANNQGLMAEVEAEAEVVAFHQRIKLAYDDFLPRIQRFMAALPGRLLQGLGEITGRLYNQFNRDDPPGELLHALHLPVAENERMMIEFASEPGRRFDALHVMSEGHIRCLGLAILLAKNIELNCPVCVFDDAVNAIDDDHRNGIWRTLFEDQVLGGKQVILTSHGEEFFNQILQGLGSQRVQADVRYYKFLPRVDGHELVVDMQPPTKNYLLLAQQRMEQDDKREALRYSRSALESLTDRIWTWMGNNGDGDISLKLGGPRAKFELNNKCVKLREALRGRAEPAALGEVTSALDDLLGIGGGAVEWRYLNSGVHHEQRDGEFDRATVRSIVQALTRFDAALTAFRRR